MWTYQQHDGALLRDGEVVGWGYSGAGQGKNNPQLQHIHDVGPIPRGLWVIEGPPAYTMTPRSYVLRLTPTGDAKTYGRAGFLIHGDSIVNPGTASEGCVILSHLLRVTIWLSGDRELMVVE